MSFRKFFYAAAILLVLTLGAPVYAKTTVASVFDSFLSALADAAEQIMPQPPLSEEIEEGAEQDYVDPREVQQVQRELRDIKRELTRFRKQLLKLKDSTNDISSIDSLLELINGFQQKVNSGENLRDTIQEFRDMQIWDEVNKFRAKIEVPNEIKQRGKEIKRIETLLKKKTTQTVADYFGIDLVGLGAKIADAKSGLAKVQEYYNNGDLDNAIEQLDEIRQDFQPWDVTSVLQRLQEMYNGVKKIKDSEIKDGVKEVLSEVVLDFNEGNYQSARELLEETSRDLMQIIYSKKGSSKEKLMDILGQLEDKVGEKSSDIWDKVKEKSAKRQEIKEEINKKVEERKNEVKQQEISKTEVCPAMPTVDKCPDGQKLVSKFISDKCGSYNTCVSDSDKTDTITTSGGQREQIWNSKGLRSWIRNDADQARIDQLKSACANVSSSMNIWMPNAGTYSSSDFGMPDPAKCARASACASDQYFDGANCVSSQSSQSGQTNTATSCATGEYWDSGTRTCKSSADACRQAGGTWDNATNYCNMPGGTSNYSGSSGGTSSSSGTPGGEGTTTGSGMDPATGCAQAGGTWDSATNYCTMPGTTTTTQQPAGFWYIIKKIFTFWK